MLGDRFKGEAPAFEEYKSYDESIYTSKESIEKEIYLAAGDHPVQDSEESTEISGKSSANLLQIVNNTEQEPVICDVCQKQTMNSNCWRSNWGQTYCQKHAFDGTPTCSACSRFKIRNVEFMSLNDGRKLCPDCHSTAVLDCESFKSMVSEMHNFYAGLNMHIRKDIPVLLVDQFEMNRLYQAPNNRTVMGLTTFKIDAIACVKWSLPQGRNIVVLKRLEYLPRHCIVTGIMVLYGYPRLLMGRILAHEFMHAWMRLQGYHGIGKWVEEGMCELMAYAWLEWYGLFGKEMYGEDEKASFMRNLKEHIMKKMEANSCKIYGDGFREAKSAVKIYGFEHTIKCIAYTGNFPC